MSATNGKPKSSSMISAMSEMRADWEAKVLPSVLPLADYQMSTTSRFNRVRGGVPTSGAGADYHDRTAAKFYRDIEYARDMAINDAMGGVLLKSLTSNVVQHGFTLEPQTGDKGLDTALYEAWQAWANDPEQCDIAGEMSFYDFEKLGFMAHVRDGDCVIRGIGDTSDAQPGSLQFHEAHEIGTKYGNTDKNIVLGVQQTPYRKRTHYWISQDDIDPQQQNYRKNAVQVPVRNEDTGIREVFHVYDRTRATHTRGKTAYAPMFIMSGMLDDCLFAKLVQQQVTSCIAILEELAATVAGGGAPPSTGPGLGNTTTEATESGSRQIQDMAPGLWHKSSPGSKLSGFSPNIPNAEFFEQVRMMLTMIGLNFDLPYVILMMDAKEANFSSVRSAKLEAGQRWIGRQINLRARFHTPVYQWKVQHFLNDDPIAKKMATKKSGKYQISKHEWNLPVLPYIQPEIEADADLTQVRNALTSPRRLHSKRGNDWELIAEETVQDNAYAIRKATVQADAMNAELKPSVPFTWRDFIGLALPEGIQGAATVGPEQPAKPAEPMNNA